MLFSFRTILVHNVIWRFNAVEFIAGESVMLLGVLLIGAGISLASTVEDWNEDAGFANFDLNWSSSYAPEDLTFDGEYIDSAGVADIFGEDFEILAWGGLKDDGTQIDHYMWVETEDAGNPAGDFKRYWVLADGSITGAKTVGGYAVIITQRRYDESIGYPNMLETAAYGSRYAGYVLGLLGTGYGYSPAGKIAGLAAAECAAGDWEESVEDFCDYIDWQVTRSHLIFKSRSDFLTWADSEWPDGHDWHCTIGYDTVTSPSAENKQKMGAFTLLGGFDSCQNTCELEFESDERTCAEMGCTGSCSEGEEVCGCSLDASCDCSWTCVDEGECVTEGGLPSTMLGYYGPEYDTEDLSWCENC